MRALWFSWFVVAVACGGSHKANQAPPPGAAGAAGKKANTAGAAGTAAEGGRAGASSGGTSASAGESGEAGSSLGDVGGTSGKGGSGGTANQGGTGGTGGGTGGTSSGTGGSGGTGGTGSVTPPVFSSFQNADVVIGQKDFVSNAKPSKLGPTVLDYASGSAAFDGKRLFVPDTYSERVLGYSSLPAGNGAAAKLVLGQASMATSGAGTSLAGLYQPQALHTDGVTLAIADSGNHRVLLTSVSSASGSEASVVVGWPDATPASGCSATLLHSPASAFIVEGKLLVADRANNRVLVWNAVPTGYGVAADVALGQGTMTSCVANDSLGNGTEGLRTASTLKGPTDVWSDGKELLVADRENNRVLVWADFPTQNGAPADFVLGQTDFGSARDDVTATGLERPSALAYTGDMLFVADSGHHRVLGWSSFPASNGAAADLVFGQSNFKRGAANDDAQSGKDGSAPTARTLAFPTGVAFAGAALVVTDGLNRRVLVFEKH
ncbi:MAG TPA: hypothetical protein VMI54_10600 [Polyangiaceae bacterium]|nr:hypothetical protein [Polyangiaceae bacterium]